jgi:protein SCO1
MKCMLLMLAAVGAFAAEFPAPDAAVIDQDGRHINFYQDLVRGKVVAVNFIFTTCTTICLPMTANFSQLQKLLGPKLGRDVQLISVTVDPENDTPARLKEWGEQFHRAPGWTFVTGPRAEILRLMRAFGVPTGDKTEHSARVTVIDAMGHRSGVSGLASPSEILKTIDAAMPESPAQRYFGDTPLVDQNGITHRFYSDLLKDKVVVINSFFSTCTSVCPPMMHKIEQIQKAIREEAGKEVFFISITVDPEHDTPARLNEYAAQFHPKSGWWFVTGDKNDVNDVLRKLGQFVDDKQDHSTILIAGNEPTGYWKKLLSLASTADLVRSITDLAKN